jgi:ketosteroid isomerase-like protein
VVARNNVETVRTAFSAWNERDLEALMDLCHPRIVFVPLRSQLEGEYHGAEGMRRYLREVDNEWESLRVAASEYRDLGDQVLIVGRFDARGRASGLETSFPAAWLVDLEAGAITRVRAYSDLDAALEAAGRREEAG